MNDASGAGSSGGPATRQAWSSPKYIRLSRRGRLRQPESARYASDDLEALASPVGMFVKERCLVGPVRRVECQHLFELWCEWAKANGRREGGTAQVFGRDLRAAVPGIKVLRSRTDNGRVRLYEGITVR